MRGEGGVELRAAPTGAALAQAWEGHEDPPLPSQSPRSPPPGAGEAAQGPARRAPLPGLDPSAQGPPGFGDAGVLPPSGDAGAPGWAPGARGGSLSGGAASAWAYAGAAPGGGPAGLGGPWGGTGGLTLRSPYSLEPGSEAPPGTMRGAGPGRVPHSPLPSERGALFPRGLAGPFVLVLALALCPLAFYWGMLCKAEVRSTPTAMVCHCPGGVQGVAQALPAAGATANSLRLASALSAAVTSEASSVAQQRSPPPSPPPPWPPSSPPPPAPPPPREDGGSPLPQGEAKSGPPAQEEARSSPLPLEEVLAHVGGPERTLVWGSASADYLDLLENWFVSVERVGYGHKVLFVSEDDDALRFLLARWPRQTITGNQLWAGLVKADHKEKARQWGTPYYNTLVDRRPQYFKAFLDLNFTFLYNDVDMVWLRDPFPFFVGKYDMWIQEDSYHFDDRLERITGKKPDSPLKGDRHPLCTCFMMLRPTPGSRRLIDAWSDYLTQRVNKSGFTPNQPAFNLVYNELPPEAVSVGVLPLGYFPSGCLYFRRTIQFPECHRMYDRYWDAVESKKTFPIVVHNNFVRGHKEKVDSFLSTNLWLIPIPEAKPRSRSKASS